MIEWLRDGDNHRHGVAAGGFVMAMTIALQMATIYIPALNPIFKTEPLDLDELVFCLILSSVVFIGVELQKWMIRRGWLMRA